MLLSRKVVGKVKGARINNDILAGIAKQNKCREYTAQVTVLDKGECNVNAQRKSTGKSLLDVSWVYGLFLPSTYHIATTRNGARFNFGLG